MSTGTLTGRKKKHSNHPWERDNFQIGEKVDLPCHTTKCLPTCWSNVMIGYET
jgi:hypothetical protein